MTTSQDRRRVAERAATVLGARSLTRRQLAEHGIGRAALRHALDTGALTRARRDRYLPAGTPPALVDAARGGGLLGCVSLLRALGVFVLEDAVLHVHVSSNASRLAYPSGDRSVRVHYGPRIGGEGRLCSSIVEAVVHSVSCQTPRASVATLDSALHLGLLGRADLDRVFARLPRRYRVLRRLIDARAESGPESLMRLLLRGVARTVEPQVHIAGVGRVDLLVDGWLVIECDSDAHHAGPDRHRVDRGRDLALAARGYTTLRPMAADIMWQPERVVAAVRGLRDARR